MLINVHAQQKEKIPFVFGLIYVPAKSTALFYLLYICKVNTSFLSTELNFRSEWDRLINWENRWRLSLKLKWLGVCPLYSLTLWLFENAQRVKRILHPPKSFLLFKKK